MMINVDNLTLEYDGHVLFSGLSFKIQKNQKVCFNGRSGGGKSSLFKMIAGLVSSGTGQIEINGQLMDQKSVWAIRRQIAYVGQEPDLGRGTVLERIHQPFQYKANIDRQWSRGELDEYCRRFNLSEKLLQKEASQLSGGEKQRIAVIVGLMLHRPILLLDEPVSAMDKESKQIFKEMLLEQSHKTVLFISHDEMLLDLADMTVDLDAYGDRS